MISLSAQEHKFINTSLGSEHIGIFNDVNCSLSSVNENNDAKTCIHLFKLL